MSFAWGSPAVAGDDPIAAAASAAATAADRALHSEAWETLRGLLSATALTEFLVLGACLGIAWGIARLMRGEPRTDNGIWFGRRIVDGVVFPALALTAALIARYALKGLVPIAVFRIAVPMLLSLLVIRIAVRVLRQAFPSSRSVRVIERSVSWIVWIGLVLWITGLLPLLLAEMEAMTWKVGGSSVSLRSLVEGAVSAAAVMVAALWASAAIEARLLAGAPTTAGDSLSIRKIAANGVRALLLLVGVLLAMSAAGIPIGALGVLGGAVGVGIGLGLQRLAANYVSGFVILAERSLRIGDMVRIDNFEGRVTDIHTRYTVIRALNGREAIVPNEMLITQRVENASLADARVALNTIVQVAYGTDVEALTPKLVQAIAAVPRVIADPRPGVQLSNFAADGLELTIAFWINDPENGHGNVRSEVNLAILRTLNGEGIEIPFPQRVVHGVPAARGAASADSAPAGPAPQAANTSVATD